MTRDLDALEFTIVIALSTIFVTGLLYFALVIVPEYTTHAGIKIMGINKLSNDYCEITTDGDIGGYYYPKIVDPLTCQQLKTGSCYGYSWDVKKWLECNCNNGGWI